MSSKYQSSDDSIKTIITDVELPFMYFEMLVKTSLQKGVSINELILMSLDKLMLESPFDIEII